MDKPPETAAKDLHQRLQMPHLAEAKAQAEAAMRPQKQQPSAADDPKMQEKYRFSIDYAGAGGRRYQGEFVNKILTIADRKLVGAMRARQSAGIPVEAFTVDLFNLFNASVWLEVSLQERPDWFKDIDALQDVGLLERVYKEVLAHEAHFRGPEEPGAVGATAGGGGQ